MTWLEANAFWQSLGSEPGKVRGLTLRKDKWWFYFDYYTTGDNNTRAVLVVAPDHFSVHQPRKTPLSRLCLHSLNRLMTNYRAEYVEPHELSEPFGTSLHVRPLMYNSEVDGQYAHRAGYGINFPGISWTPAWSPIRPAAFRNLYEMTKRRYHRCDGEEPALCLHVLEDIYDRLRWLVYADWLEERGDRAYEDIRIACSRGRFR